MKRPDFRHRADTIELMDTEASAIEDYAACLADLAQVNVVTLAYRPTLAFLDRIAPLAPSGRKLRILDVGAGYGDMLRRIGRWAEWRGIAVELTGIDLNPRARQAAPEGDVPISWVTADVLDYHPAEQPDVVLSSLFAHHLDDAQIVGFLRWMEAQAQLGWFLSDLQRHPLPYDLFRLLATVARWHRFVRYDGPVSISRAFVQADWRRYLTAAGLDEARVAIAWQLPFRLCLTRLRGPS